MIPQKMSNAFTVLYEESRVLREKARKQRAEQRAEQRRAKKEAAALEREAAMLAKRNEIYDKATLIKIKWSSIADDDDDDDDAYGYEYTTKKTSKSGEEEQYTDESDDNEDVNEELPDTSADMQEVIRREELHRASSTKDVPLTIAAKSTEAERPLSRKERQKLQRQELDDLHTLLQDFGLGDNPHQQTCDTQETLAPQEPPTADPAKVSCAKAKKKKKKREAKATETSLPEAHPKESTEPEDIASHASVSGDTRNDIRASIPIKATKKKTKAALVSDTVLAEAKKRSEREKANKKKDKFKFEH